VLIDPATGNAEWQPGTNHGFPGQPIRKSAGVYCIPLPNGVDGTTAAVMLTPTGYPSLDDVVAPTDCSNTTGWAEVYVYEGLEILDQNGQPYPNPVFGLDLNHQHDVAFQVLIP
jgi:hypothetical protein